MRCSRAVLAWLDRAESWGIRSELIGDLHEELARGRSTAWLYGQLLSAASHTGSMWIRGKLETPSGIRCAMVGLGLLALAVVPPGRLIQAWLSLYYLTGMLSLFAHMTSADVELSRDEAEN